MQRKGWRPHAYLIGAAIALAGPALLAQSATAGFIQHKLIGADGIGGGLEQGRSVALSADGNTAIVGGYGDNGAAGAAWVFTRSNGVWTQQAKLVGWGAVGPQVEQGYSVALSADGNTALVGGWNDNSGTGAAWVFTRNNGVWTQQGGKLVGTGATGSAEQASSVALSADGNTALIGGPTDNSNAGAAWVFTRNNGVWTQQGGKLVATSAVGSAEQGYSVALSPDGNAAILGGPNDNSNAGAAWVFVRSNGVWRQQGKLVGTDAVGNAQQGWSVALALAVEGTGGTRTAIVGGIRDNGGFGAAWVFTDNGDGMWTQQGSKFTGTGGYSVALSADGNIALVGDPGVNSDLGAAWMFTRSNGVWTQQGSKLVGTGTVGTLVIEGSSVALSADGKTAMLGGPDDNYFNGAAWVFTKSTAGTHDFNGDSLSDIAWRDTAGNAAAWLISGAQVVNSGSFGMVPTNWTLAGQRDFNGDGNYDWLWRDSSGNTAIWLLNGLSILQTGSLGNVPTSWSIAGTGDFNGDGMGDLLWRDSSGNAAIWLMNGLSILQTGSLGNIPTTWSVVGVADFNGDGMADILWRDSSGNVAIWLMNGLSILQAVTLGVMPTNWSVVATGDFNGDGKWDIVWRDTSSGYVAIWLMNGVEILQSGLISAVPNYWVVAETGDFNGDGMSDLLWRDTTTGTLGIWFINGMQVAGSAGVGTVSTSWAIQGLNAD